MNEPGERLFPVAQKNSPRVISLEPRDILDEKIIRPITELNVPGLEAAAITLFPTELLTQQVAAVDADAVVKSALNPNIAPRYQKDNPFDTETAKILLAQDLQERAVDRAGLLTAITIKTRVAAHIANTAEAELKRQSYEKRSDTPEIVTEAMGQQAARLVDDLNKLSTQGLEIKIEPQTDARALFEQKQTFFYQAQLLAGLAIATEKVAPEMINLSNFHRGLMQADLRDTAGIVSDRRAGIYVRENAGTWAHLLGLNIAREHRLPDKDKSSDYEIEVYTSGMGAMSAVMDGIQRVLQPDSIMTAGMYFELPSIAKANGIIKEVVPADDNFYMTLARMLKEDTAKPMVVYAQPFGSGIDEQVFDLDRTLALIKNYPSTRPVVLVMDTTMHGTTINPWDQVNKINESGQDFTLIQMQSLVKHGQLGADATPGGFAIAYGSRPKIIRASTGSRGAMMPEANAAFLFPLNGELQDHRIQRAARNIDYIANTLKDSLKDVPFYDGVFYPSGKEVDQYTAKPPFLFIKLSSVVPNRTLTRIQMDLAGLHNTFTETGVGTSYGFDGTRFELINLGEDNATYIRIAAGQESVLQLMAITQRIEKILLAPETLKGAGEIIRDEIYQATHPFTYTKESVPNTIYYDPEFKPHNPSDRYINSLTSRPIQDYMYDQMRCRKWLEQFTANPKLQQALGVTAKHIEELSTYIDPDLKFRDNIVQWVITTPNFINKFREKYKMGSHQLQPETVYSLARAAIDRRGVLIVLAPIARLVNNILNELKPEIEETIGGKLSFDF